MSRLVAVSERSITSQCSQGLTGRVFEWFTQPWRKYRAGKRGRQWQTTLAQLSLTPAGSRLPHTQGWESKKGPALPHRARKPNHSLSALILPANASLATATAIAAASRCTRPSLVDDQIASAEGQVIELLDGRARLAVIVHLDEPEASGAPGFSVGDDIDGLHDTVFLEEPSELVLGCTEWDASYVNLHFLLPNPCPRCRDSEPQHSSGHPLRFAQPLPLSRHGRWNHMDLPTDGKEKLNAPIWKVEVGASPAVA